MESRAVAIGRTLVAAACLLVVGLTAQAQVTRVPVRLTVSLSDSGATPAPVPHFMLLIHRGSETMPALTDDHGVAAVALPAGEYRVTSFRPYVWRGQEFSWSLALTVRGDSTALDLTARNAGGMLAPAEGWPAVAHALGLDPDALVRVTTTQGARYTGSLLFAHPDTLAVREGAQALAMPTRSIALVEVSHKSYELGIATGAGIGLVAGVLFGNAPVYVLAGAVVGLLLPFETWQPVPLLHP